MRILYPVLVPFPSARAPAVQVAGMAQALGELGHEVTLVSPVPGDMDVAEVIGRPPAFRHVALSDRVHRGQSYLHALRIARMARDTRPDLLLGRNLRACLLPARRGVPTVLEAHTVGSLAGRQDRWVLGQLAAAPGFRGIVAISQALADDLVRELGVDPARILVAHDAVDGRTIADGPAPGRTRDGSPLRVAYTGSLYPGKGADLLLDVAARCPWVHVTIAGGPEARATVLREQVTRTGLRNVTVVGPLTPSAARDLQRANDVLVAPFSRRVESDSGQDIARWTSPIKLFEYLASGRPSIVGDLPVLREVLRPDVDALLVEPDDPDAVVEALTRLRDDPGLGERLAASALERVRTEFTWEIRARRILERFGA